MRLATLALALAPAATLALAEPVAAQEAHDWTVDASHSSVLFKVKHMNVSWFFGRFIDFEGKIHFDPTEPAKNSVELDVKTQSVRTWSRDRDDHLKGPDFFNVAEFPLMTFRSKAVEKAGEDRFRVTGDFTLHGVTKEIAVEVEKTGEGTGLRGEPRIGFYTEFRIKRSDYGMTTYVAEGAVGDEVTVILSLEATR
ncbi:MAG: YceI family protein [Planctomycetes bacterium]|nr:YceI family protein [Planctomycetota bacterium]